MPTPKKRKPITDPETFLRKFRKGERCIITVSRNSIRDIEIIRKHDPDFCKHMLPGFRRMLARGLALDAYLTAAIERCAYEDQDISEHISTIKMISARFDDGRWH